MYVFICTMGITCQITYQHQKSYWQALNHIETYLSFESGLLRRNSVKVQVL